MWKRRVKVTRTLYVESSTAREPKAEIAHMTQHSLVRGNNYVRMLNRLFISAPPNESFVICDTLDRGAFARDVIEPLYYQDVCADCIIYGTVNEFSVIRAVIEVFLRRCVPRSYSLDDIPFASEKLRRFLRKKTETYPSG